MKVREIDCICGDLRSDLDPWMLFFLRLFAMQNSATPLLFARCQHSNAEAGFDIVTVYVIISLTVRTETYSRRFELYECFLVI